MFTDKMIAEQRRAVTRIAKRTHSRVRALHKASPVTVIKFSEGHCTEILQESGAPDHVAALDLATQINKQAQGIQ
jgi:hypothetical protein